MWDSNVESERARALCLLLGGLLGHQHAVDGWEDTATGNGHCTQQLGELLVITDSQLDVAGHDAGLLVVAGGIAGQLKHLENEK